MSEQQRYLNIGNVEHPVTVWWAPTQPDRVQVTTGDPQFRDENGEKAGLRIVFSSNPKSADYNPGNFNRVARALAAARIPAPDPVPVHPRHLRSRNQVAAHLIPPVDLCMSGSARVGPLGVRSASYTSTSR